MMYVTFTLTGFIFKKIESNGHMVQKGSNYVFQELSYTYFIHQFIRAFANLREKKNVIQSIRNKAIKKDIGELPGHNESEQTQFTKEHQLSVFQLLLFYYLHYVKEKLLDKQNDTTFNNDKG